MPYVMQFETWKKLTEVSMKPRSKYLKSIDKSLERYQKTKSDSDLKKLKLALHHWKMSKGFPDWKTSERNRNKAVETLDLQLFGMRDAKAVGVLADLAELPFYGIELWAEDAARQALKQARQEALTELLYGKKIAFKKSELAKTGYFLKSKISKIRKGAQEAQQAATAAVTDPIKHAAWEAVGPLREPAQRAVQAMLNEVLSAFPVAVAEEVMKFLAGLIPDFIGELAASVAPYLSIATSGAKALKNTGSAVVKEYQWVKATEHAGAFGGGDPVAAAQALLRMIERARNQNLRLAGIYATDATVKAASVAADAAAFGAPTVSAVVTPLQGMATALAVLSLQVFLLARDIHEMRRANKALAVLPLPKLSATMFDKCPIIGCYYIACSNTSDIINMCVDDMGATGWMLDVEVMVKNHISPMIGYARDAISSSRLEVSGLDQSKGVVADVSPGWTKTHTRLKQKMINKVKSALPFTDNMQDHEVFAQKTQGVKVLSSDQMKNRMGGIGPQGFIPPKR